MKINTPAPDTFTHGGAKAAHASLYEQLKRTVLACMLFEDNFYEDGKTCAQRIEELCSKCTKRQILDLATLASDKYLLRHIPLKLIVEAFKKNEPCSQMKDVIAYICKRPDQMTDLVALYWKDGKKPLPAQLKLGISKAFLKFDEYQLAKYNRDNPIQLRDIAFLCHVKVGYFLKDKGRLIANLVNEEYYPEKTKSGFQVKETYGIDGKPGLKTPDTWEVALSSGKDKAETWNRLLSEKKLGKLALLRNLRNMLNSGIDPRLVAETLLGNKQQLLPFQFLAAAKECPQWEGMIDQSMIQSCQSKPKLQGKTIVLVDVSGSMDSPTSSKSKIMRMDAACGLAILLRECCDQVQFFTFSDSIVPIPNRQGMALRDSLVNSQPHGGTYIGRALQAIISNQMAFDRMIIITDEQSNDPIPQVQRSKNYILNVGTYQNGVGSNNNWTTISGFAEASIDYISELESLD